MEEYSILEKPPFSYSLLDIFALSIFGIKFKIKYTNKNPNKKTSGVKFLLFLS